MNKTRAKRLCTQNEVSSINKNNTEVDRIGRLPDKVLTHILSFLSTKEAVQTCVLSKRWKNTWTAVPILDIKQNDFSGFEDDEERRMSSTRSERFITGFLDNRAPTNLERVHCVCEFLCSHDSMGWLDRVVLLMPLQIHIFISGTGNSIDMPDLVFSCATLQHLLMSNYPDCSPMKTFISPVSVNLPSLKFLELNGIELHDDFAEKFFMGCPSLERLELCGCDLYFTCISSEVLNELTLISCTLYEQMQISCPHLVSLIMTINLKRAGISMKNMSSLVNVDIKLYAYPGKYVPDLDIFGSLSNAAKLELFLGTAVLKESLEKDITNCRNFNNLKKLVVGANWDMSYDFYLIACLLKRSPNLKELVLLLNERQGQRQESRREVSGDVLFQHEYLEVVKIGQAYGYMFDQSKLSREPINAMMKTLGTYVKNIGNIIIT